MATQRNLRSIDAETLAAQTATGTKHAVHLPGGNWEAWRSFCLRGAGFPAKLVLHLAAPGAAAAADRFSRAQRQREEALHEALQQLRDSGAADPAQRSQIRALRRLRRKLRRGIVDEDCARIDLRPLAAAIRREERSRDELASAYDSDAQSLRSALEGLASDPRFQEAAMWQTGPAIGFAAKSLQRQSGQKLHEASRFIALLTQRYAVKNDTCGFFGPSGWPRLDDALDGYMHIETASELTSCCSIYFEGWAIDELAESFNREPEARRWAIPRIRSEVWLGGAGPFAPGRGLVEVSQSELRLLQACDGRRSAHAIAQELACGNGSSMATEEDVFAAIQRLVENELMIWRFEVNPQLHPQEQLRGIIEAIGDEALRRRFAQDLDQLTQGRDRVAEACGDPEELAKRLAELDGTFTRITGKSATRRPGMMYSARNILYKDCRRAGSLTLGRAFLDQVGPAISIVLDGARWLLGEVAQELRRCLRDCLAELRGIEGEGEIDAQRFLGHTKKDSWLIDVVEPKLGELRQRYQAAWAAVLVDPISESPHRVAFDVAATAQRARLIFGSPQESWSLVRQLSPDIMVCADGPEAFRRGDFQLTMGELHTGNTLTWSALAAQHPSLESLLETLADATEGETIVLKQKPVRGWLARTNPLLVLPRFWRFEYDKDLSSLPACNRLPAAKLVVIDEGQGVRFRARDGSFECDALEIFAEYLSPPIHAILGQMRPKSPHAPRLDLGPLTLMRETWNPKKAEMPFPAESDKSRRFAEIRAWAREQGMPRWVFYTIPDEPKPCFLDFDSPVLTDVFAKFLKRLEPNQGVKIVEMKPCLDETWLVDSRNDRYTCECRIVAQPRR